MYILYNISTIDLTKAIVANFPTTFIVFHYDTAIIAAYWDKKNLEEQFNSYPSVISKDKSSSFIMPHNEN